jgi:NitT/TauT family transport system ATP-binding protein
MEFEISIRRKALRAASGSTRTILHDVALRLRQSEICALLGPSGSGKTTLLKIISGLDTDFEGRVFIPPLRKIGMVFQEPRLLPWRTVAQNLQLVANIGESELAGLAAALGLSKHLEHFPGELSLGLARRVAIARAFAVKPDLLLLDEPFVSLDTALAARMREELLALVLKQSAATLLVTHDIEEALSIADRIFVLSGAPGRLLADLHIGAPRTAMRPEEAAALKAKILALMAEPCDR